VGDLYTNIYGNCIYLAVMDHIMYSLNLVPAYPDVRGIERKTIKTSVLLMFVQGNEVSFPMELCSTCMFFLFQTISIFLFRIILYILCRL